MELKASLKDSNFFVEMESGDHKIFADEPEDLGGKDLAPAPNELLLSALASCTTITLRMYAGRKEWNLGEINVVLNLKKVDNKNIIEKSISFSNKNLDADQTKRLLQIADKCPVNKMLSNGIEIVSSN